MLKLLIASLALAVFASTFIAVDVHAGPRPCIKAPKNYLPCPMKTQRPQLSRTGTR
jgi:hypothetical protein